MALKNSKTNTETTNTEIKKYYYFMKKPLSEREKEVLELIVEGKSNKEIGNILKISKNTVKAHTEKIYEKLAVEDRVQAAVKAVTLGIID